MKALGLITALAGLIGGVAAVVVGVQSIPDIKRYIKMRAM